MKKPLKRTVRILAGAVAAFVLLSGSLPAHAASEPIAVSAQVSYKEEQVPFRFILEAQGAVVSWNNDTKTAKAILKDLSLEIKPGTKEAVVNGKARTSSSEINSAHGRITVPLALINEAFSLNLSYDSCISILSGSFTQSLAAGRIDDCLFLQSAYLKNRTSPQIMAQLSASFNSFGALSESGKTVSGNLVHQNVTTHYSSPLMGDLDFILRFNDVAQVDDLILKQTYSVPNQAPEYDDSSKYIQKEVVIGQGEWSLPGTLTLPAGEGPFPAVVLVHGSGPNDRDETLGPLKPFRDLSVGLASKGIAVLAYEKRSYEHNLKIAALADITTWEETTEDAILAGELLKTLKEIDSSQIYVAGHSQGATLVPRILETTKESLFKGGIVLSGITRSIADVMLAQYEYLYSLGMATKAQVDFYRGQLEMVKAAGFNPDNPPAGFMLGTPYWWQDMHSVNPASTAKKLTSPLLILQGERDYQVTAKEDYQGWLDALEGRDNVAFKLYPKLNHMFTEGEGAMSTPQEYYLPANVPSYVIEDIASWIINP